LYHFVDTVLNSSSGRPLPGVIVRLLDADGNSVAIFADGNGTPIEEVSGVENAALTASDGSYDFWVEDGEYSLSFTAGPNAFRIVDDIRVGTPGIRIVSDASQFSGAADHTEMLRTIHQQANAAGVRVVYTGIPELRIQYDAAIPINTPVDFGGAKITLLGGALETPVYPTTGAFKVADPDTPWTFTSGVSFDGSLVPAGGLRPTEQFSTAPGFYNLFCEDGPVCPDRYSGSLTWRQPFMVMADGNAMEGSSRALTGCTSVGYGYRPNPSAGWIDIGNFQFDVNNANSGCVLWVERNQTRVYGVRAVVEAAPPGETKNQYITVYRAGSVAVEDLRGHGSPATANGSYLLWIMDAADIRVDRIVTDGGWGWVATHNTNGFYASRCNVNRFDIHGGGHNFEISNCVYRFMGYGWGGGRLKISDCFSQASSAIRHRTDYTGAWFGGGWVISDHTIYDADDFAAGVDLQTVPIGANYASVPAPPFIVIDGLHAIGNGSAASFLQIRSVAMAGRTDGAYQPVVHPMTISVNNVTADRLFFHSMDIDPANMVQPSSFGAQIVINNVRASAPLIAANPASTSVIHVLPQVRVDTTAFPLQLEVTASTNVCVDFTNLTATSTSRVQINGGSCNGLYLPSGLRASLVNVEFANPILLGGATEAKVGGPVAGQHFTSLHGCRIRLGDWDLSNVGAISGLVMEAPADVILPSALPTITRETAFTGWIAGALIP